MHQGTGIEKEAAAFIIFMLMLASLDMAWSLSGPSNTQYAHARASGKMLASDLVLKQSPKHKRGFKTKRRAVKPSHRPTAPAPRDIRRELADFFLVRGSNYPPGQVTLIAVKEERRLEVWATGRDGAMRYIMEHPICAVSGMYGPKLRRGDRQVPEGVYYVTGLNPYSKYHLSIGLNYPNEFDRKMAASEGRTDLGGNIFIHGDCRSIGCIAMGDAAIEELYALVRDTGIANTRVIIAPWDLRKKSGRFVLAPGMPEWTPALYKDIALAMAPYSNKGPYGIGLAMAAGASRSY